MNLIIAGVLAPLAYLLLRLFFKSLVISFLNKAKAQSEVKEMVSCYECGVFIDKNDAIKKSNQYFCGKKECLRNV
ncbi:MAG: hypothetical protein O3C54_01805 [Proteobacteria bacterium]|nr:hypothetical protein [Pseudomonadota bacterium]